MEKQTLCINLFKYKKWRSLNSKVVFYSGESRTNQCLIDLIFVYRTVKEPDGMEDWYWFRPERIIGPIFIWRVSCMYTREKIRSRSLFVLLPSDYFIDWLEEFAFRWLALSLSFSFSGGNRTKRQGTFRNLCPQQMWFSFIKGRSS